jgi:Zn-dependent protease with chaperone function
MLDRESVGTILLSVIIAAVVAAFLMMGAPIDAAAAITGVLVVAVVTGIVATLITLFIARKKRTGKA